MFYSATMRAMNSLTRFPTANVHYALFFLSLFIVLSGLFDRSVFAQMSTPSSDAVIQQIKNAKIAFPVEKLRQHPSKEIVAGIGNEGTRIALIKFLENGDIETFSAVEVPSGKVHDVQFGEDERYLYAVGTSTDSRFKRSVLKTIADLTKSPVDLRAIEKGAIFRIDTQTNDIRVRRLSEEFVSSRISVSGNSIVISDEVSSILLRFEADRIFTSELNDEKILLSDPEKNAFVGSSEIDFINSSGAQYAGTPLYSHGDKTVYMLGNSGDLSNVLRLLPGTKSASFQFKAEVGRFFALTFDSQASLSIYDVSAVDARREVFQRLSLDLDKLLHDDEEFLQRRKDVAKGSALLDVSRQSDMIAIASRFSKNLLLYRAAPNAIERMNLARLAREPHNIMLSNNGQFLLITHKDSLELTLITQLAQWLPNTTSFSGNDHIREAQNVVAKESQIKGRSEFFIIDGFFGRDTEMAFREFAAEKGVPLPAKLTSFQDQVKAAQAIGKWASNDTTAAIDPELTIQRQDIAKTEGCEIGDSQLYLDIEGMAELAKRRKAPFRLFCQSGDKKFPIKVDVVEIDIRTESAKRLTTHHTTCAFLKKAYPKLKIELCG